MTAVGRSTSVNTPGTSVVERSRGMSLAERSLGMSAEERSPAAEGQHYVGRLGLGWGQRAASLWPVHWPTVLYCRSSHWEDSMSVRHMTAHRRTPKVLKHMQF